MTTCADCPAVIDRPYAKYCDACRWRHRGKKPIYVWTADKDQFLRERYNSLERHCGDRIAKRWGWPGYVVRLRACRLGLTAPREALGFRAWTADEVALIERSLGARHPRWIARKLQRSLTSVIVKIKRLGMSVSLDGYTARAVGLGFGVDGKTVTRWIETGRLSARKTSADGDYRITDGALQRFIREQRTSYDLRKVDQVWFLDLMLPLARERAA